MITYMTFCRACDQSRWFYDVANRDAYVSDHEDATGHYVQQDSPSIQDGFTPEEVYRRGHLLMITAIEEGYRFPDGRTPPTTASIGVRAEYKTAWGQINERPDIVRTTPLAHDGRGYRARTMCLVDGYPAEIRIIVDVDKPRYSAFQVRAFHPSQLWQTIHQFQPDEVDVGSLPVDGSAALVRLNEIATDLWRSANLIVTVARTRDAQLDRGVPR